MTDETIFVLCDWLVVMNNSNGATGRMKQLYPTCAAQGGILQQLPQLCLLLTLLIIALSGDGRQALLRTAPHSCQL